MLHQSEAHDQTVVVNWCLGNTCNYSCSYCPEGLHDGSYPWTELSVIQTFCQNMISHYRDRLKSQLFFEFTGGEVSLYRDFIPLIQFLREQNAMVAMISNGSRRIDWWQKARPFLNHICLSFHAESADPEHFKNVVRFLNETVTVHVNVMMHPQKFDVCTEMAKWVVNANENVTLAVQPLLVDLASELYPYTDEQRAFLSNPHLHARITRELTKYRGAMQAYFDDGSRTVTTPQQLIANNQNHWRGWNCWVGVKQLVIDFNGNVYRGWCREGGRLGHVQDGQRMKFPDGPIVCGKKLCHCVLDVMNRREARESFN
jgi:sulfatase maturation enzyme AslB (radical SAM superfamily)